MIEIVSVGKPSMSSHGNAATINSSSAPALKTTKPRTINTRRGAEGEHGRERGRDRDRHRDQEDQRPLAGADADPHPVHTAADSGLV